jgi:hypothetical protein
MKTILKFLHESKEQRTVNISISITVIINIISLLTDA